MFSYQESLSWKAHWKVQSHFSPDRGLFYFFQDLPLPNERGVPLMRGVVIFSDSEERL